MSLLNEYKELEAIRQKEAEASDEHYKTADLPGTRTFGVNADDVRRRIEEMKEEKAQPNHDKK